MRDPYSMQDLGNEVHRKMENKGFIVVKIEVLKHDALLPPPIEFEHTLGGALESYEIWTESDLEPHCHDHPINIHQDRFTFKFKKFLLHMNAQEQACALPKGS